MDRQELFNGVDILNGKAKLSVSNDGLQAIVTLSSESILDEMINELFETLKKYGIINGILKKPELQSDQSYVIARGVESINGVDGHIELEVDLKGYEESFSEKLKKKIAVKNNSTVEHDPKQLKIACNVNQRDIIAKKIPPTQGVPGKNIFGEVIPAIGGKWVAFKLGSGVEIISNDFALAASMDGKVEMDSDGKISVVDEWILPGSVDASTGHIEFWGKRLIIPGSVTGGYKVISRGDIEIGSNIEDESVVKSAENIKVQGIIRAAETFVSADRNIECQAIEYAKVKVAGNLQVYDYILDAVVDVRGETSIIGGKGLMAGGRLWSGQSISAGRAGTAANVPTEIRAGYDPFMVDLANRLHLEIKELFTKLKQLKLGREKIDEIHAKKNITEKTEELENELITAIENIKEEIDKKKKELESVEESIKQLELSTVQIFGITYPNVLISIGNAELKIKNEVSNALFKFRKGQIVTLTK